MERDRRHEHPVSSPETPLLVAEPASVDVESTGEALDEALRGITPWTVSLLVHLGIVVIALFLVWSTITVRQKDEFTGKVELRSVTPSTDTLHKSDQPDIDQPSSRPPAPSAQVADARPVDEPVIQPTVGPGSLLPAEPAAPSPQWGTTGETGKSMFSGVGLGKGKPGDGVPQAKRIVFVIDASGSLIGELDFVIRQLKDTIQQLGDEQKFTVIFFQRDYAIEAAGRGLRAATDENKIKVQDWISTGAGNVTPGGSSNPVAALKLAFGYKPDLVYILSDNITGSGVYQVDRDALIAEVAKLNAAAKARVHTIQFLYPDPQETLRKISDQNGGEHKLIEEADLLGRDRITRRRIPGA